MNDKIVLLYDSYVNHKDQELFLCKTKVTDLKWFRKEVVPHDLLANYNQKKIKESTISTTCNTDKSSIFSCEMKCKTRGIQLACGNCGIILGYRELFGAESCTQVAQMYLDLCVAYKGKD